MSSSSTVENNGEDIIEREPDAELTNTIYYRCWHASKDLKLSVFLGLLATLGVVFTIYFDVEAFGDLTYGEYDNEVIVAHLITYVFSSLIFEPLFVLALYGINYKNKNKWYCLNLGFLTNIAKSVVFLFLIFLGNSYINYYQNMDIGYSVLIIISVMMVQWIIIGSYILIKYNKKTTNGLKRFAKFCIKNKFTSSGIVLGTISSILLFVVIGETFSEFANLNFDAGKIYGFGFLYLIIILFECIFYGPIIEGRPVIIRHLDKKIKSLQKYSRRRIFTNMLFYSLLIKNIIAMVFILVPYWFYNDKFVNVSITMLFSLFVVISFLLGEMIILYGLFRLLAVIIYHSIIYPIKACSNSRNNARNGTRNNVPMV